VTEDHQSVQVDGGCGVCVERSFAWKHFLPLSECQPDSRRRSLPPCCKAEAST
jgi:hypothetical protein